MKADTDQKLEAVFVTLPYDAKKTEITVNDTAATSAGVTIAISGDVITVGGSNKNEAEGPDPGWYPDCWCKCCCQDH